MQNGMIDLYVRGNNSVAYSEIYSSFTSEKNSYISDLLLLVINNDSSKVRKHGETYFTIRMGNREATQYYTKSENHTLDIPYGEDLWCLEYPSNYRFWEKID